MKPFQPLVSKLGYRNIYANPFHKTRGIMKALILSAGKGSRVRPITYAVPKPMMPILNKPVLEILIERLKKNDINEIMINTGYLSPLIENYFRDGSRLGVEIAYSYEGFIENGEIIDQPLGSAGAIKKIQRHSGFFDDTFIVICGDAVVDLNFRDLVAFHKKNNSIATIALKNVPLDEVSSYGVVVTDDDGRISNFQEKPVVHEAKSTLINTGIYVFEPEILTDIPDREVYDIGSQLFPALVKKKKPFFGLELDFQWLDIGKVQDYYQVLQMAIKGEINDFMISGKQIMPGIYAGLNVKANFDKIDIQPPVYIGGSTRLGDNCVIKGPSIIGQGCDISSNAIIDQSAIFDYLSLGPEANVVDMLVFGSFCIHADGTVIDLEKSGISWIIADARIKQDEILESYYNFVNESN